MVASGLGLTGGVGSLLGIRVHNDHSIGILDGNHRGGNGEYVITRDDRPTKLLVCGSDTSNRSEALWRVYNPHF